MQLKNVLRGSVLVIAAAIGFNVAASIDPCQTCDEEFWSCGGWQNDYCVLKYETCLRRNGCPVSE